MNKYNNLFYLNKEIKRIQEDIKDVEDRMYPCLAPKEGGRSNKTSDVVGNLIPKYSHLKDKLRYKLEQKLMERERIERFIDKIDDADARLIFRLRAVNNMTWEEIAREVHCDRRTASRKYYKVLEVAHNAH